MRTEEEDHAIRLRFELKAKDKREVKDVSDRIQPGQWVFAVAVYDGQKMILYQDAVEVGRRDDQDGPIEDKDQDEAPVWIGTSPRDPTKRPWKGLLDEVAVFDRGLTPAQVRALYEARRPHPVVVRWDD